MRWTNEMRGVIRENYPQKTYKEIASMLGVSYRSIERQLRSNMFNIELKNEYLDCLPGIILAQTISFSISLVPNDSFIRILYTAPYFILIMIII